MEAVQARDVLRVGGSEMSVMLRVCKQWRTWTLEYACNNWILCLANSCAVLDDTTAVRVRHVNPSTPITVWNCTTHLYLSPDEHPSLLNNMSMLGDKIIHLEIPSMRYIPLVLPFSSLVHLTLGPAFTQPLEGILPESLQSLVLGVGWNHPVDTLPRRLKHLALGDAFRQPVDGGRLPPLLQTLILGNAFNSTVDELPSTLQELTLGDAFHQSLDRLPLGLRFLSISETYVQNCHPRSYVLPANTVLTTGECVTLTNPLTVIQNASSINERTAPSLARLPRSLRTLSIHECFRFRGRPVFAISNNAPAEILENLPAELQCLSLSSCFSQLPVHLPGVLDRLNIDNIIPKAHFSRIPPSVQTIQFGESTKNKACYVPEGVRHVIVLAKVHPRTWKYLPNSVHTITMAESNSSLLEESGRKFERVIKRPQQ